MPRLGASFLAFAYAIAAAANFLLSVAVGRGQGAAALGAFALAVATARIFYAVTDLGLSTHLTRVVSRDPRSTGGLVSMFLSARVLLIPLAMAVSATVAWRSAHSEILLFVTVAMALGFVSIQALYEAVLLSRTKQRTAAALTMSGALLVVIVSVLWFALGAGVGAFGVCYAIACGLGMFTWMSWTAARLGVRPRLELDRQALLAHVRQSWPTGASVLLGIAALRAPIVVLGIFDSTEHVGAFAAVDTVVVAGGILQVAVTNSSFPQLAATYRSAPQQFRRTYWTSNGVLALAGVLTAAFLAFAGVPLLSLVFPSKEFEGIAELLPIVALSAPALFLVHHNIYIFAAADRQRTNVALMVLWFVAILVGQLVLVPSYGAIGSAWGVLLGRAVGLVLVTAVSTTTSIHRGAVA